MRVQHSKHSKRSNEAGQGVGGFLGGAERVALDQSQLVVVDVRPRVEGAVRHRSVAGLAQLVGVWQEQKDVLGDL